MSNFHRPTFTKKAALRHLPYFELLLEQLTSHSPQGMFLSTEQFGGIGVTTLQVRFGDALLWLTKHNIDDKEDKTKDFQYLKASVRTKKEEGGLRILLMVGPRPETTIRKDKEVESVATWKTKVEDFLGDDSRKICILPNVILTSEELDWVKRVALATRGSSVSVTVSGDKLVIAVE